MYVYYHSIFMKFNNRQKPIYDDGSQLGSLAFTLEWVTD